MFSVIQLKLIHVKHSSIEIVLSNHKIMHMGFFFNGLFFKPLGFSYPA